ncbi:MAG: GNAT family N-acetyltransferase [Elusimicrobia bacterium]|nr:GNAT family N-acetyltransferase [Elusimicrobiota bacterium]
MSLVLQPFVGGQERWLNCCESFHDLSLIQTWEYAQAKAIAGNWQTERLMFEEGGEVVGLAQVMLRRPPLLRQGLAWINRGPLWRRSDAERWERLLAMAVMLKNYWVIERGFYLRLALPVAAENFPAEDFFRQGFGSTRDPGWVSMRLHLTGETQKLRQSLDQKWRNCLNKSERQGIEWSIGPDQESFGVFLAEYERMLSQKGFLTTMSPEFFKIWRSLQQPGKEFLAAVGRHQGAVAGAVLLARYGNTVEYLAGAFNEIGRRLNAGHFLIWRSIEWLKTHGVLCFDLGGADPERTPPGIFHFKAGVKGQPYRLAPELESYAGLISKVVRWRVNRARSAGAAGAGI